ncbi:MAG: threonine/serine dehydratase [Armatimonadetes bacterium]|nr:threonine/serine dehydratase [Armatimonadota bacterium]MDW8028476.1 threonine/serine dehydratase [Armatimonadota bacterium]
MAEKSELAFGVSLGQVTWQMVQKAKIWVSRNLPKTPMIEVAEISNLLGLRLFFKAENLQWTGAFKIRGGLVKLLSVPEEVRKRGVVCASTGNHGKGIAFIARRFGIPAWVVVPERTPKVKTEAIKAMGARLIRFGETYAQAEDFAKAFASERGLVYAPSFDDPWVVAAQATIAWEILEDEPEVDTIIVPVGGGALLAGTLITAKQLKPSLRVIGVEAEGAPALTTSLSVGEVVTLQQVNTLAEGIAVSRPGFVPFQIILQLLEEPLVLVSDDEMKEAVGEIVRLSKLVPELAGAAAFAALLSGKIEIKPNAIVACVITGGNIDLNLLCEILSK